MNEIKKTSISMSSQTAQLIEKAAAEEGSNKTQIINNAIRFYVKNQEASGRIFDEIAKMHSKLDVVISLLAKKP